MRGKFAVLGLILVMGLAGLSLGYAYWTENLNINGTVTTGSLSIEFVSTTPQVTNPAGGSCTATFGGTNLTVAVTGAYPGFACAVPLQVRNTGSIDARLAAPPPTVTVTSIPSSWVTAAIAPPGLPIPVGPQVSIGGVVFTVPGGETGFEGVTDGTFSLTIVATQLNAMP